MSSTDGNLIKTKSNHTFLKFIIFLIMMFVLIPGLIVGTVKILELDIKFKTKYKNNIDEKKGRKDEQINLKEALIISIPLFLIFVGGLYEFIRKLKHHLISYRPTYLSILTGICTAIYCVSLPILLHLQGIGKSNCVITMIFTNLFATMSMMANLARYVKSYLLNKRDIGKMKLYNENYNPIFPGSERSVDDFEPNAYLKRLNTLVTKKITFIFFVVPYTVLAIISIVIALKFSKKCSESGIIFYSAIMFLCGVTGLLVPYIFISLYSTLSFVDKVDMFINFACLILGSALYVFSLFGFEKEGVNINPFINLPSNSLFFIIPSFSSFFCANCIPLIEVYISDRKLKQKKMISKKEFTKLLLGSRYIESLKACAIRCYCVETVIFWDMHAKLMKLVSSGMVRREEHPFQLHHEKQKLENITPEKKLSPTQNNYELLLGLNKNIFGSSNNAILYTGGSINNNAVDPSFVKAINHGTEDRCRPFNFNVGLEEGPKNTLPAVTISTKNGMNYPLGNPYNNNNNNNNYNKNYDRYYKNGRNDMMNTFYDTINNSDKDGLLNHDIRGYDRYNDSFNGNVRFSGNFNNFNNYNNVNSHNQSFRFSNNFNDNFNNYTNINNSFASYNDSTLIRKRRSAMKNNETEILYDIFDVDPDENQLPEQYWKDFENLYNSFISEKSLATVNLDTDTVSRLKRAINNKDYTIDMFFPAIAETVDLIYQNLYPKLLTH